MLVRAKEHCFVDGLRRRAGSEFEFEGAKVPSFLEPIGPVSKEEATKETVITKRTKKHEVTTSDEQVI